MFRYTMIYSSPVDILHACIPTDFHIQCPHSEPLIFRCFRKNVPMKLKTSIGSNKPSFICNLKRGQPRPTRSTSPQKREKAPSMLGNLGKICPKSLELRLGWSLLAPESSNSSFLAACGYVDSNF